MGPSGIITKIDRAITALKFIKYEKTTPSHSERVSEISHAIDRLTTWKPAYRKLRKQADAPRLAEEAESANYNFQKIEKVLHNDQLWIDYFRIIHRSKHAAISDGDIKMATAAVAVTFLYNSCQRPSAVAGLTLKELDERRPREDVWVLSVANHKTAMKGPAHLTLDQDGMDRVDAYVRHVRPQIDPTEAYDTVLLLPGCKPVKHLSNLTKLLEKEYKIEVPTATKIRKAVARQVSQECDETTVNKVAASMSHSIQTHRRYYQSLQTEADAADVHKIVKRLRSESLSPEPQQKKKKRIPYDDKEEDAIHQWFQDHIEINSQVPTLGECREFLGNFSNHNRSAKQIQDHVRHIIED